MPDLRGDYDLNGVVDAADYVAWRKTLGANVALFSGADGNGNAVIDQPDYNVWRKNFAETLPGSGATSPSDLATASAQMSYIEWNARSTDQLPLNISIPIGHSKFMRLKRAMEHASSAGDLESGDLVALLVAEYTDVASAKDEMLNYTMMNRMNASDSTRSTKLESIVDRMFANWSPSGVTDPELDSLQGSGV